MTLKYKALCMGTAAFLALGMHSASAGTVEVNQYTKNKETPEAVIVDLSVYDINDDGQYSMVEVGERLFYDFDTDGNQVIDNMEWDDRIYRTIRPMERETFVYVDYDDDGWVEESSYTYETFYEKSGLSMFTDNEEGLSASDFIETSFQELDDNDSGTIDLEEWQEEYLGDRLQHNQPENYQN
jgi:hypothetical protein